MSFESTHTPEQLPERTIRGCVIWAEQLHRLLKKHPFRNLGLATVLDKVAGTETTGMLAGIKRGSNLDYSLSGIEAGIKGVRRLRGSFPDDVYRCVFSPIDESNKFSEGYNDCFGIAAIGIDESGKKISMLAHLDPKLFFDGQKGDDERSRIFIRKAVADFKQVACDRPFDIAIFGGRKRYGKVSDPFHAERFKVLHDIVQEVTGKDVKPLVPANESYDKGFLHVHLENKTGNLSMVLPEQKLRTTE